MTTRGEQFTVDLTLGDGYAFNVEFANGEGPPLTRAARELIAQ